MNKRLQTEVIKTRCGKKILGRGKCYICGCMVSKKGMVIHHLEYIFNDVVRSAPKYQPRNDSTTLLYHQDLEPLIKDTPTRFMYLCNTHHTALEKFNRFGDPILNKLLKARKLIKTRR